MNTRSNILVVMLSLFSVGLLPAQESGADSCIATAQKLAAAKDYPAAVRILREHLFTQPADRGAARLLAQMFYWSGDAESADSTYTHLLSLNPDDAATRIEFGRFLLETGRYDRLGTIVGSLAAQGNAEAKTMLGTSLYWQGDWAGAVRYFKNALSLQPDQNEARQHLFEIRSATAPAVSVSPEYQSDNQPIRRAGVSLNASLHFTPLLPVTVSAGSSQIEVTDTTRTFQHANLILSNTWATSGVTLEAAAGISRLESMAAAANYRAALSAKLSGPFLLTVYAEHTPSFETVSSFSTEVTTTAWGLTLERSGQRTWIGRASFQRKRYFDGNTGLQVYAWFLSSPGKAAGTTLQFGYGFSFQDTNADRYVQTSDGVAVYAPYYTPLEQISHSALLLLTVPFSSSTIFRVNGSYGVVASELAPTFSQKSMGPGPGNLLTVKSFQQRSFSPWQLRASLDADFSSALHLRIGISRQESAYYQVSLVNAVLSYTFVPDPDQR